MEIKEKKYGLFGNIGFMIKEAMEVAPSVIVYLILIVLITVSIQTAQLLFTPMLLDTIATDANFKNLLILILKFSSILIILNGILGYINGNILFGRIHVRTSLIGKSIIKNGSTSYSNIYNQNFQRLLDKSVDDALGGNNSAGETIWETITLILESILGIIVYLYFMTKIDIWIIVLTIATTIISFFFTKKTNAWGYENRMELGNILKERNYILDRSNNNIFAKDIRIFNMKSWIEEILQKTYRLYRDFRFREFRVYIKGDLIDLILSLLRNGIAYSYIIKMTIDGNLSASNFVLLFTAINGLTDWTGKLLTNTNKLYKESLDIATVREFLDYPEPFKFEEGKSIIPDINKKYSIELKNLSFKYDGSEEYILKDINLKIKPGEKLAVVGLNGAGKTTLVKLLSGYFDPTDGEVLLNGENIKQFNRRDIYKHFTAVFQDFSLIAGNIYQNIAQTYDEDIDIEKADITIENAGLTDRIDRFPKKGYTNLVKKVYNDAVELSGGELQRLMLARALYKNAPILILDEPTAALDPIAENEIYLKYDNMTKNHTSIFISHRLASTRFCDRILFIAEKRKVAEGTHEELLKKYGYYAELFNIQSKYYQDNGGEEYEECI